MKKQYRHILLAILLFFFCALLSNISLSIYKEIQGDSIDLSVMDPSTTFTVTFNAMGGDAVPSRYKAYN